MSGGNKDGTQGDVFFATIKVTNGVPTILKSSLLPEVDGKILDFKIVEINDTVRVLSTGFRARNQSARDTILGTANAQNASGTFMLGVSYLVEDYDVMVGIFPMSRIGDALHPLTAYDFKYYTSGQFDPQGHFTPLDNFPVGSALIPVTAWAADPCPAQYGPCTPGKSGLLGTPNASPVVDNYFGAISKDIGRSIVYTNGYIYVSAEMRTLEMTGSTYRNLHTNNENAVVIKDLNCPDGGEETRYYDAYKDAYIHILKFDTNGNLIDKKNVAHCSGGDFYGAITVDRNDGKIVLATNTADRGICDLPDIDLCHNGSVNTLQKIDTTSLQTVWQQHQIVYGEANCVFGILQTADGGFVSIGNNEFEAANGHDQETFNIIRYTGDCQAGTFFDQDGDYTVTLNSDTWSPTTKHKANFGLFQNCAKGVVWNPMNAFSNGSKLSNTRFAFTAPLADGLYKPSNEGPSKEAVASELSCQLRSVKDITFTNITCINTMADGLFSIQRTRPTGIYAVDSKFSVMGGAASPHYGKLYVGVESASAIGGAASTLSITSNFDRVYQGVNVRGNVTPVISGCQFNHIPDKTDSESGDPAGVHSTGTQGILLSANQFDSQAGYDNYASRIDNSLGTGGAKVEFNQFTDMNVANLFEKDNASLKTHCNIYQGAVGEASWRVKGSLADQGDPFFPAGPKPDNKFIWDCIPNILLDIRNSNTTAFAYVERQVSQANLNTILNCWENISVVIDFSSTGEAQCVIEDPCPNPPYCNQLMGLYASSGYSLPYRNDLLNAYVRMSPDAVADSLYLPGTTRAIALLANRNQQEDKRILAATYASLGNYSTAQQYLQQVTGATTEIQDFIFYYTVLINAGLAGRDAYHLTAAEFAQLAPLMTHTSTVVEQIKVLDHILNGVYHPLVAESGIGGRPSGDRSDETVDDLTNERLGVLPNPFESEVRFIAPEGTVIKTLSIVDVSGKTIYSQKLGDGSSMLLLNTASMPQGLLFYQCQLSDGKTLRGKIIHQSKK